MITGDHVLTAAHVATETTITTQPQLILSKKQDAVAWVSVDGNTTIPFEAEMVTRKCMSGNQFCTLLLPQR